MKLSDYLSDQKWLIISFTVTMGFILTVIIVDPQLKVDAGSLFYLLFVSILIFSIYLAVNYYQKMKYYQDLHLCYKHDEVIDYPSATTKEGELYQQLLKKQQENYLKQIHILNEEKKEWQEYMTSWFHEIKTPISVSRMLYEVEEHGESLAEEMDKIEHYLEQALYYSRLSDFHKDYLIQGVDLDKLVKTAIKYHRKTFLAKKIKLKLDLSNLSVLTDKKGLLFIMNQILSNALKYSSQAGGIEIVLDEKSRTLSIRDNGIGIDAGDLPRIFEKGFTGKNGRQYQKSTGMGLYLAKKISGKLGHQLIYSSKKNCYTEAVLYFPKEEEILYRKK
jgi:signal transduction histidine kinase